MTTRQVNPRQADFDFCPRPWSKRLDDLKRRNIESTEESTR